MKRRNLIVKCVCFGVLVLLSGCSDLSLGGTEKSEREQANIDGLPVILKTNLTSELLGMDTNEIETSLFSSIPQSRSQEGDIESTSYSLDLVTDSVESILRNVTFPDFQVDPDCEVFPQEQLEIIRNDFPTLSDEEIAENFLTIQNIYNEQLSALTLLEVKSRMSGKGGISESTANSKSGIDDYLSVEWDGKVVTIYEIAACLEHPLSAVTLDEQREVALRLTEEAMNIDRQSRNTRSDAFRHAAWNVVMAKYGVGLKGEKIEWARDFATAHEKGIKYVEYESEMDYHNNSIGRYYYSDETARVYVKLLPFGLLKVEVGVAYEPTNSEIKDDLSIKANNAIFVSPEFPLGFAKTLMKVFLSNDIMVYMKND